MGSIPLGQDATRPGWPIAESIRAVPWRRWVGPALSATLAVSLAIVVRDQGMDRLRAALPTAPAFWLAFVAYYLALPAAEFVIYRRLWSLPASGFVALLRKLVCNELLVGYSGELSFYLFARENGRLTGSPFQAIKDVSILSATAGNVATLAMLALALPILQSWWPDILPTHAGPSLVALVAAVAAVGVLRRRLFSLPGDQLRFIAAVHLARVAATTMLMALMWRAALPAVPLPVWIGLSALQLMVTRLPFVPNKDIVFAGVAMLAVGAGTPTAALMALIASLLVTAHLLTGAVVVAVGLAGKGQGA